MCFKRVTLNCLLSQRLSVFQTCKVGDRLQTGTSSKGQWNRRSARAYLVGAKQKPDIKCSVVWEHLLIGRNRKWPMSDGWPIVGHDSISWPLKVTVCLSTVQLMHAYKRTVINITSSRCIVAVNACDEQRQSPWQSCVHVCSCEVSRMEPKQVVQRLTRIKDSLKSATFMNCLFIY